MLAGDVLPLEFTVPPGLEILEVVHPAAGLSLGLPTPPTLTDQASDQGDHHRGPFTLLMDRHGLVGKVV